MKMLVQYFKNIDIEELLESCFDGFVYLMLFIAICLLIFLTCILPNVMFNAVIGICVFVVLCLIVGKVVRRYYKIM